MATGGAEFGREDPDPDYQLGHDDDGEEKEINRTQTFQPYAVSTPYNGGERVEMQTMQNEQSGLPDDSYQETPLLGAQAEQERSWETTTRYLPNASAIDLETFYSRTKRVMVKMMGAGKKAYPLFTTERKTGKQRINPDLPKEILKALGPPAEEIIAEDRDTIQEERQRLKETENELKQAEKLLANKEQLDQDLQEVTRKKERAQAQLDALNDEHGSNLGIEADVRRLEILVKKFDKEEKKIKKELASVSKNVKKKQELQAKADRQRESIAEKQREKDTMQERLNQTKTLDNLKEQERELQRKKAEYEAVTQDENASPSDIQAAQDGLEDINERLPPLQTEIAERERARPLLERIKEIFKKYGVTVTSVLLAAGVTIGVVVSTVTNALKASTKALGKGLKDIGAKLGSLLPGLIGSIANFLFKAAGQAIGFLAEHTWLLILAVVAFLFEKYQKKRR